MHLFLSPHADDAALSCGGQIAQLTRRGERVLIFTIMAGDPPVEFKPTPFSQKLHTEWGLGDNPVPGRHAEDEAAARILGAEIRFGPYPDCIYRVDPQTGIALYPDEAAICGPVQPGDPLNDVTRAAVIQAIVGLFNVQPTDTLHIPLAVGRHVDHQIVRDLGKALIRWRPNNPVYFYEDFPYTRQGEAAIQAAVKSLDLEVTRVMHALDADAIDARIAAIKCYRSQLASLKWPTPVSMATEVRSTIAQIGGEREWRLLFVSDSPLN